MAVARVGTIAAANGGAASFNIASNASTVTGNLLVLHVGSGSTVSSITGGAGGTWTQFGTTQSTSNVLTHVQIWRKIAESGDNGGATYTVTLAVSAQYNASLDVWSGSTPRLRGFGATVSNTGGSAVIATPLTRNTTDEGAIAFGAGNTYAAGPTCTTTGSGWTERSDGANGTLTAGSTSTAGASVSATCTFTWTQTCDSRVAVVSVVTDIAVPTIVSTLTAGGSTDPAVISWPNNVQAGDLMLFAFYAQGSIDSEPSGWTALGTRVTTTGIDLLVYAKVADGTETSSTTISVGFSAPNNWISILSHAHHSLAMTLSWVKQYSANFDASAGSSVVAPSLGTLTASQLGYATGGAYDGTNGAEGVTGTGWAFVVSQSQGAPHAVASLATSPGTATGSATLTFTNSYVSHLSASLFLDSPSSGFPLLLASL